MVDHPSKKRRRTETAAAASSDTKSSNSTSTSAFRANSTSPPPSAPKSILKKIQKPDPPTSDSEASAADNDEFTDLNNGDGVYDDSSTDPDPDSDSDSDSISSVLAAASQDAQTKKRKCNDPAVFSMSMSKILNSHLTTRSRQDPVLVRSKSKVQTIDESKLEARAKKVLVLEKKNELEKGRVKDVLPQGDDAAVSKALEREKALRKIAQRGVVKLFNAVRAAQVKAEEVAQEARKNGVIGMGNREQKVTEMSKQGFLDLIQATK
ncbi:Rrp15p-domain-containing protein [Kalaharituber pfeilii]|nr:Rrp15p-domain-containing protein [Kalaharituber pfeilii]